MDETNAKREARRRRILENSENRLRMITSKRSLEETEDTMDETTIKREARRRRILENSENRLHKITARQNLDETKADKSLEENDGIIPSLKECTIRNGTCNIESNRNFHHYTGFNEDEYERYHSRFSEDIHDEPDERFLSNINVKDTYFSEQVYYEKSILCTYLSYRIILIMSAVIVNILLILKLDAWFGKVIFIPYLLLLMGRLYNFEKLQEKKCNNLISIVSTVILWKIKPNSICKLKILLMLCNIIIKDFFLYIFSFVLTRYVITTCYYYSHDLMHNYS